MTNSLAFRLLLDEARFAESREAVVEPSWEQWTSSPIRIARLSTPGAPQSLVPCQWIAAWASAARYMQ